MPLQDQIEDFTNALVSCGNILVREAARMFRPHGITPAQFNVLNLIVIHGRGLRPSEIAEALVVDPASTTYLLKQVEERGWVRRIDDLSDRRAYTVELTVEGRAKADEVIPVYKAALVVLARILGERPEVRECQGLLADIPEAAQRTTEEIARRYPAASTPEDKAPRKGRAKAKGAAASAEGPSPTRKLGRRGKAG